MITVVIFGSRGWEDYDAIEERLYATQEFFGPIKVIHGGAKGADDLGGKAAKALNCPVKIYEPDYERYGRYGAPKKRNEYMAMIAERGLGFWDGTSGGTKHMIKALTDNRVPFEVNF